MSFVIATDDDVLIAEALRSASDTRRLIARAGVRHDVAAEFQLQFGDRLPIVIADQNTFAGSGADVCASFWRAGRPLADPFILGPHVYANDTCVDEFRQALEASTAVPIAVGSGTINDLTKLAAFQTNRPYMALATAASMDGYTAYGASITAKGSKQTFECPAPQAVLADLEVIASAPPSLNAAGYADLLAKLAAGADWIVADELGIETIDKDVWKTVQYRLRAWVDSPGGVARGEATALRQLVNGLMMSGFAMQAARSSRPASGAEHQFSHLWDMQSHTHDGSAPSHGFKVGLGTLASVALYEDLLRRDLGALDVDEAVSRWPSLDQLLAHVTSLFETRALADKASEETTAKYLPKEAIRDQLLRLREVWPELRTKLHGHLYPFSRMRAMLNQAGCPTLPEQIGISRQRLRLSYEQALFVRRRFTVLDLAHRTGLFQDCLASLFAPQGAWDA